MGGVHKCVYCGLRFSDGEIFVEVDGQTLIHRECIKKLMDTVEGLETEVEDIRAQVNILEESIFEQLDKELSREARK